MAKKSSIVKNEKRRRLAEKFEPIRRELRKKIANPKLSAEERVAAGLKLQKTAKIQLTLPGCESVSYYRPVTGKF